MLGLVLAMLGAAWQYFTGKPDVYMLYMSSASWLYGWYIWTTVIYVVFYVVIALLLLGGLTVYGGSEGGVLGFLGGVHYRSSCLFFSPFPAPV